MNTKPGTKPHEKYKNRATNGHFTGPQPNAITTSNAVVMARRGHEKRIENMRTLAMDAMSSGVPPGKIEKFMQAHPNYDRQYAGLGVILATRAEVAADPKSGTAGVKSAELLMKASGHMEDRRQAPKTPPSSGDITISALVDAVDKLVSMKDTLTMPTICGSCGNSVDECTCG